MILKELSDNIKDKGRKDRYARFLDSLTYYYSHPSQRIKLFTPSDNVSCDSEVFENLIKECEETNT